MQFLTSILVSPVSAHTRNKLNSLNNINSTKMEFNKVIRSSKIRFFVSPSQWLSTSLSHSLYRRATKCVYSTHFSLLLLTTNTTSPMKFVKHNLWDVTNVASTDGRGNFVKGCNLMSLKAELLRDDIALRCVFTAWLFTTSVNIKLAFL